MSNLMVIEDPTPTKAPIREIISVLLLIFGSILISVGSFLAFGLAIGLIILGILFVVVSVLFGLNR